MDHYGETPAEGCRLCLRFPVLITSLAEPTVDKGSFDLHKRKETWLYICCSVGGCVWVVTWKSRSRGREDAAWVQTGYVPSWSYLRSFSCPPEKDKFGWLAVERLQISERGCWHGGDRAGQGWGTCLVPHSLSVSKQRRRKGDRPTSTL